MKEFYVCITMPESELSKTLEEIQEHVEAIYCCYSKLNKIGFSIIEKAPSAPSDDAAQND